MEKDQDFYIGWQDEMPKTQKSALRKFLIPLFIVLPIIVLLAVWFQKPFNNHLFALGNVQEYTGVYFADPVPMFKADPGQLESGLSNDILLVGYGKFGAEGIMEAIEKDKGSLSGKKMQIKGTLINGDGKTVLELTKKENSLVKILGPSGTMLEKKPPLTGTTLTGEILDPKCYFGVMKPGEGKVHKSCAIRCISGGIPPVFRAENTGNNRYQYYIMLGKNGEKINKDVLPFVAEQISVSGRKTQKHGWEVLYVDINSIVNNE